MGLPLTGGVVPLESVISTAELDRRASRPPAHEAENRALSALMQEMASTSGNVLQKVVESALTLCGAHSAGISILEETPGGKVFRWRAVAGRWSHFLGGTMPREVSPCGTVLDRNAALLLSRPERHYPFPPEIMPPIAEVLLIPFHVDGEPVGTIWVIAHDESRRFEAEDLRLMTSLGRFAATAHQLLAAQAEHSVSIAKLERAQHDLTQADHRKDEFLAMLSHELRNPLAAIHNATHIVRRSDADGPLLQRAADMLERQTRQLVRLIDDLLDASRVSRGTIELRKERVDVRSPIQFAVESIHGLSASKRQELSVTLPPEALYVDADPVRLSQVVSNLLSNACKFTGESGGIELALGREDGNAVIRVRDNGIGIAAGDLPLIFEMFTQLDASIERTHSGLGIGLALAKTLVQMHGGSLEARSAGAGLGSEFVVRLPCA